MDIELKNCRAYLEEKEKEWENLCLRCGACCGAFDDPCIHLKKDKDNKFYCDTYRERFGIRKTVSGDIFRCISIKQLLDTHWKGDHRCAYKK